MSSETADAIVSELAVWHDFEGDWWIGQDRWLRIQVHKLNGEHEWLYALAPDSVEVTRVP